MLPAKKDKNHRHSSRDVTAIHSHHSLYALCALIATGSVCAQSAVPGAAQPGQIEQPFRRDPAVRPSMSLDVPAMTTKLPEQAQQVRFQVSEVVLEGGAMSQPAETPEMLRSLAGREVSLADIYALADRLTALYRNQGFVLSQVLVPEQKITDGRVRLVAVEGYIADIIFEGANSGQLGRLTQLAARIKASRPLRADVLERYLLLMNDQPGSYAQAIVQAAPGNTGASNLVIRFTGRSFDATAEINNRGSKAIGPINLAANVSVYSTIVPFDILTFGVDSTPNNELQFVSAGYDVPVGFDGLTVGASASYARAHPDVGSVFDVRTRSASADLHANFPLLRTRTRNVSVRGAFAWLEGKTEVSALPLTNDRVRTLRLSISADQTDSLLGVNTAEVNIVRGLDLAGATKQGAADSSRVDAPPNFTKFTLYAARLQSLAPRVDLLAALSGQYAHAPLFPSEQFGFGGATFGRAYDASELLGDSGASAKLELRYAGTAIGQALRAYTLYSFYEMGTIWRRNPINQKARESAADAGVGMRFNLLQNLSGYVELAKPLTHDVHANNDRKPRGFAALRWTF